MHSKQIDRLVNKMKKLTEIYQKYVIEERITIDNVLLNGKKISSGDAWGKDFEYGIFSFNVENIDESKKYYIYAATGGTEHLISVNGKKIGMLDYVEGANDPLSRIHKYTLLENLKNGDEVTLEAYFSHPFPGTFPYHTESTFSLDSLNNNRPFEKIELVVFNEELKHLVIDLQMISELYDTGDSAQKAYLVEIYEQLFQVLSLKDEAPTTLSVKSALEITKNVRTEYSQVKPYVGIIGHSHLDTAWLWTTEETNHKLLRTVSNAVTLLKKYPDYKFFLSTVYYLDYIKKTDSALYQEVVKLIKEGRLEANGGSFIEFDSNLIGNESICRQFLRGQRFLSKETGIKSDTFWLPDTFGYAVSLPQILKQADIKYFLTTKLSWNDTNTFPYDTFKWIGLNGDSVLTHFNTIHCWVDPVTVKTRVENVIDKNTTTDTLIAYGFGDGGGGPSKEMVERALDTCHTYSGATVEHTTVSDFMKRLEAKKLPEYYGELYLELHRGTYTSIHDIKKYHAKLEVLLHDLDLYSVCSNEHLKPVIDEAYDILMLNEFHDILPGTCINEVNTKAIHDLKETCEKIEKQYFSEGTLFNPTSVSRIDKIDGKYYATGSFEKLGGPSLAPDDNAMKFNDGQVVTMNFSVKFQNGLISSLKQSTELVKSLFGVLKYSENIPYIYDNWDIDADYKLKEKPLEFIKAEEPVKANNEYVVTSYWKAKESIVKCIITVDQVLNYINFQYDLDIKDDHLLIRSYFDTTIFSDHYTSDIQFGNIKRNTRNSSHTDEAKFETCSHKWVDLSNPSYGLSILKKDLYGTSCDGNVIGITLHKGGTHPDNIHEMGHHQVSFALYPHRNDLSMLTIEEAYIYNYPLIKVKEDFKSIAKMIQTESVIIETIKEAEDGGIIIRAYEALGEDSTAFIGFDDEYQIVETNILEEPVGKASKGKSMWITFKPFEIKTFLLRK